MRLGGWRLGGIVFLLGLTACTLGQRPPEAAGDPFALATQTALAQSAAPTASPAVSTPTVAASTPTDTPTATPDNGEPWGKIVFTCQIYKAQASDQICIMNADGSGYRRLTTENDRRHFYPSLAPDGRSVVYSAYTGSNHFDIFEITLPDGEPRQLTQDLGILTAPEISPDGSLIAFTYGDPYRDTHAIWVMNRDGGDPHQVWGPPDGNAWDPTWSPDGSQILFASDRSGRVQLYVVNLDGSGLRQVTEASNLRGRSDWSAQGWMTTYSGTPWHRNVYIFHADGSDWQRVSPDGGNAQGPSFSPDGKWLAVTAYYDRYEDIHGCEIYIMRLDGSDLRRLTINDYCDWQPRWGP